MTLPTICTARIVKWFVVETLIETSFNCFFFSLFTVPLITIPPENKKVKPGTNIELKCEAVGSPEPSYFWTKNGHTLKFTNRIYIAADNRTLNIDHVKESDAGKFECIAENSLGSDGAASQVEVINSHGPPNIIFEPYDLEAIPGTTIELPCGAEGDSPPVVRLIDIIIIIMTEAKLMFEINSHFITVQVEKRWSHID